MAISSSYVTAPNKTTVGNYKIAKVGSKVNTELVTVNSKATQYYQYMYNGYGMLNSSYKTIATLFTNAANNIVKGDALAAPLKKAASACANSATEALTRRSELQTAFEFAQIEARIRVLEEALGQYK